METHRLVFTEDLNQYGYLFGGRLLSWSDEASFIAASADFPHCRFVTIGMDKVEFRHAVKNGTILKIVSKLERRGDTSVTYQVDVFSNKEPERASIFSTKVTFVNVDEAGTKCPI